MVKHHCQWISFVGVLFLLLKKNERALTLAPFVVSMRSCVLFVDPWINVCRASLMAHRLV